MGQRTLVVQACEGLLKMVVPCTYQRCEWHIACPQALPSSAAHLPFSTSPTITEDYRSHGQLLPTTRILVHFPSKQAQHGLDISQDLSSTTPLPPRFDKLCHSNVIFIPHNYNEPYHSLASNSPSIGLLPPKRFAPPSLPHAPVGDTGN